MATTLPVALGLLTKKKVETGISYANTHVHARANTQALSGNKDGV